MTKPNGALRDALQLRNWLVAVHRCVDHASKRDLSAMPGSEGSLQELLHTRRAVSQGSTRVENYYAGRGPARPHKAHQRTSALPGVRGPIRAERRERGSEVAFA